MEWFITYGPFARVSVKSCNDSELDSDYEIDYCKFYTFTGSLHKDIYQGEKKTVIQYQLDKGIVDVESRGDKQGATPLHVASYYGREDIVNLLLRYNADVNRGNAKGTNALHLAAQANHKNIVEILLDAGADIDSRDKFGVTALHWAAQNGCDEIVKLLLERGARVDSRDYLRQTPLHGSFWYPKVVNLLLDAGADINTKRRDGSTILHLSVIASNLVKPIKLIPNNNLTAVPTSEKLYPLLIASYMLNWKQKYAEIATTSNSDVASVVESAVPVIEILLKREADVNECNKYGKTALFYARADNTVRKMLIEKQN
jgi:ankyrin repeat protein